MFEHSVRLISGRHKFVAFLENILSKGRAARWVQNLATRVKMANKRDFFQLIKHERTSNFEPQKIQRCFL